MNALTSENIKDIYTLSPMQEGMYFHFVYDPLSSVYFEQVSFRIHGELNVSVVEKSLNELLKRYDVLRTVFNHEKMNRPLQVVLKQRQIDFFYKDLYIENGDEGVERLDKDMAERYIKEFREKERQRPFYLNKDVLMRVALFRLDETRYEIIWSYHHILMDGWCLEILISEYLTIYDSFLKNKPYSLPPVTPYRTYIQWLEKQDKQASKSFWQKYLESYEEVATFPRMSSPDTSKKNKYEPGYACCVLPLDKTIELIELSRSSNVTLNTIAQAAWGILLARYNGRKDVVYGQVVSGRPSQIEGVETMVGLFINTIPIRIHIEENMKFTRLLLNIQADAFEVEPYQYYPLAEIQAESRLKQNLIDHVVGFHNLPLADQIDGLTERNRDRANDEGAGLRFAYTDAFSINNYDITIKITAGQQLSIEIQYNKNVCDKNLMDGIARQFIRILEQALENRDIYTERLTLLTGEEKHRLLHEFNHADTASAAGYFRDKTLCELFEVQVEKNPDNIAAVYEEYKLTYGELNKKANQMAGFLRVKGVKPGSIVGIMLKRSLDMIVVILGILKAGGAYLPINPDYPEKRVQYMLEDSGASILVTGSDILKTHRFTALQQLKSNYVKPILTGLRPQIRDLDHLPIPDRSLVNYEKYSEYIGLAMGKHVIALQGSRGCPFNCAYCHKIWPKTHIIRTAENIFAELEVYYNMGVRRFALIDDIFNLDRKNSIRFYELIIEKGLDIQLFFPNGVRGDILDEDYIDLMVKAGTVCIGLALETASPRLQKLIGKNMNLRALRRNVEYFCSKYPHVILELFIMHGFPTETEEEAKMTLDFAKSLKWIHFPYFHILKIYPNTDMERLALEHGVPGGAIARSENLAYHELPDTLPFDKSFTLKCQTDFLNEYFLSRERLLHVLPYQMKILSEDEIVQKYNSYLPMEINSFADLLRFVDIKEDELGTMEFADENRLRIPGLHEKMKNDFPTNVPGKNALKVLFLDLSQFFSSESDMLYDVVEPPLGLMYVLTYLNRHLGSRINGKIAKSRIDFDNYDQLKALVQEFKPDVIGVRSLTFYREFFHKAAAMIRQWQPDVPILAGGPYATSDRERILQDRNVDLVVMGEGEVTALEVFTKIIENGGKLPDVSVLSEIKGIAFIPPGTKRRQAPGRDIVMMDMLARQLAEESGENLEFTRSSADPAYIIYTSGSTGKPKGVIIEHQNVSTLMSNSVSMFAFTSADIWTMFHSYAFDFSVWEMFGALLFGGKLIVIPELLTRDLERYLEILREEQVTVLNQTPTVFYTLAFKELTHPDRGLNLTYIIFGGEALSPIRLREWKNKYPDTKLVNMFGITETTVHVTYKEITPREIGLNVSNIGKPLPTLTTYVMDSHLNLLPREVPGELGVGGCGVGRGYLNKPELTRIKFVENPFKPGERLYKSGDLVKLPDNGEMEYLGRIDHQVKIRGFRIELGEIENQLLTYDGVKDAVVMVGGNGIGERGDKYLCAYIVAGREFTVPEVREYLSRKLPDYMIPSCFIQLDKIPLNVNGKVDRRTLSQYEFKLSSGQYAAPGNEVEKKLVEIWSEVLGIERDIISIDSSFFDLGGHSLKVTVMVSKIHKALDVKIPIPQVFETPSIRGLASCITKTGEDKYASIEPAEEKEYYLLSSVQKGIYAVHQMNLKGTAYNVPQIFILNGTTGKEELAGVFRELLKRHDILRTSFDLVDGEPVQKIHEYGNIEFEIEYFDLAAENSEVTGENRGIDHSKFIIQNSFIRPFELSQAPLLRVGLSKLPEEERHLMMIDMHHIIADGVSHGILVKEFLALSAGEQLPGIRLQYKDYSQWLDSSVQQEILEKQESYWLSRIEGHSSTLDLLLDYPRPEMMSFEGKNLSFEIGKKQLEILEELAKSHDATLFMILLAVYNILLFKLTGQEDVTVGTVTAGRRHADLENMIGMLVNTLALRNKPEGHKTFSEFLNELRRSTLEAFENQDYPFEELVLKVGQNREESKHPIFDTIFVMQTQNNPLVKLNVNERKEEANTSLAAGFDHQITHFDLLLVASEKDGKLNLVFEYATKLFKEETIASFATYFKKIVFSIIEDPDQKLLNIEILSAEEKNRLLEKFKDKKGNLFEVEVEADGAISEESVVDFDF